MLKNIALVALTLIFISGCGGGGGGNSKKSSSSVAMSSTSKMSTSSAVSSSLSSSSQSSANVITLQADTWVANNGAILSLNTQGVTLAMTTEYQGAKYTYDPATSLKNSVIKAVVSVDSGFKASGAGLQLFAFVDQDPWPAQENCPIVINEELTVGADITITCVLDKEIFNQTAINVGFGVQAVLPTAGSPLPEAADTPRPLSGTIIIKSARIELGDPNASSSSSSSSSTGSSSSANEGIVEIPTANLYFTGDAQAGDGSIAHGVSGATVDVSADYKGAGFTLDPPFTDMRNGSIEFVTNVSSAFKASGAGLIIYIYQTQDPFHGKGCEVTANVALTAGEDQAISCVLDTDIFDATSPIEFKLSAVPGLMTVDGTFLIKSVQINLSGSEGSSSSSGTSASSASSSVVSSSASSMSSVSESSSATSMSSASSTPDSSSSSSQVASTDVVLDASGWSANQSAVVSQNMQGVLVSVSGEYGGAKLSYNPDVSLQNAVVEVVVDVSDEFKAAAAGLQLFVYVDADPYPSQAGCLVTVSADLTAGMEKVISCTLSNAAFTQTLANVGIGIQTVADWDNGTPVPVTGTFVIKSARIVPGSASSSSNSSSEASSSQISSSSSSSSAQNIVLTMDPAVNFYGKNGVVVDQVNGGGSVNYLADWDAAGFSVSPTAIEGHTVEIDFQASQSFKDSGGALYIYAQVDASPYPSESDCSWVTNSSLIANTPQTIQCTISTGGVFNQTNDWLDIRLVARYDTGTPNGAVLVTGGRVLAP